MYMSYCKFEGTLHELRRCLDTVNEHAAQEADERVSEREIRAFRTLVREFAGWLQETGMVDGELNEDVLDEACEYMRFSAEEVSE